MSRQGDHQEAPSGISPQSNNSRSSPRLSKTCLFIKIHCNGGERQGVVGSSYVEGNLVDLRRLCLGQYLILSEIGDIVVWPWFFQIKKSNSLNSTTRCPSQPLSLSLWMTVLFFFTTAFAFRFEPRLTQGPSSPSSASSSSLCAMCAACSSSRSRSSC